ncbi:2-amino-4-hydroxy-6-hydroxymethyldihydropteridine diphosphokinase [Primorskyibacter aestuariivivens]|nr:2-amino-4-hydroxy-6-hydroxymethyldihydropteridine diphosphokinase [Primorskyibacter aestuariivivens]MDA7430506.1 2-amino-4-hydroxy-6-hydroxymethyldihydropteridine diphosphokinase [Primorskyibacter aestuariivivens]
MALIALGANLDSPSGPPIKSLPLAIEALSDAGAMIRARSRFYGTPCFPAGAGPDYVNAAIAVGWTGSAHALLGLLHEIEARFARQRTERWGMRTLDLDLIAFGATVLPDAATYTHWRDLPLGAQMTETPGQLIVPHPRLQDRAFVLVPLMDVAPDWRHPVLGQTVRDMHDALPISERDEIKPL